MDHLCYSVLCLLYFRARLFIDALWSPTGKGNIIFEPKIVSVLLSISFNSFDGSFEYPQHMFGLRNKKIIIWYASLTKVLYLVLYFSYCFL